MSGQAGTPTLQVQQNYSDGQSSERTIFLSQRTVKIGRGEANDLRVDVNLTFVSTNHARIEPTPEGGYQIVDSSTNGTFINDQQLEKGKPRPLHPGDVIYLGARSNSASTVVLTYQAQPDSSIPTQVLGQGTPATPPSVGVPAAVPSGQKTEIATPGTAPRTQVLTLNTFDPKAQKTTIGREGCDINLNHPLVSRFHAQIDRLPDGSHKLRDAGSTNGTFVNGQRIHQCILTKGDIIKIGPFKITYTEDHHLNQYDQRGAIRIDARGMFLKSSRKGDPPRLNNISLSIAPREFVALVGGSGAGKSTLLKAISGYERDLEKGTVIINGDNYYKNFDAYRMMLGYVPQDDILHHSLPVENALQYIAHLRLPPDTKPHEVEERIKKALELVEMEPHRFKPIKNLSGGQRKRVSIAAELLTEPSLFFLDEPTSGLDPGLEKKMMETLRGLADQGRTVVLVTHATENITQCHQVVFMSRGRLIYYGPPSEALDFFGGKQTGVETFSDIYTRIDGKVDPNDPQMHFVHTVLSDELMEWQSNPKKQQQPTLPELWEAKYRKSPQFQRYVKERIDQRPPEPVVSREQDGGSQKTPSISMWRQYWFQTKRYLELTYRDFKNLLILLLQAPIIAILLWLLAKREVLVGVTGEDLIPRVEVLRVLFMLAAVAVWFGVINAARELTKERAIFERERFSKLNLFSYLSSKVTILGILVFLQNVFLLGILSLQFSGQGVEFPENPGGFDPLIAPVWLETFITLFLTSLAGTALGLLVSSFSTTSDQAISIVPLLIIPQIFFAGLIFKIEAPDTVISAIIWGFSLLMISRWTLDALGTTFNVGKLCQLPNVNYDDKIQSQCEVSKQLLDSNDPTTSQFVDTMPFLEEGIAKPDTFHGALGYDAFEYTVPHLGTTWGVLGVFTVVCLGLTAYFLKRNG